MEKRFILDSSAIFSVQQIFSSFLQNSNQSSTIFLTTPEIIDEFKDSMSKLRLEGMISSGELKIEQVNPQIKAEIIQQTQIIGNYDRLSEPDKSVLALALYEKKTNPDKQITILTDDFEIQNTAKILKIFFQPVRTNGISYSVKFQKKCSVCNEKLEENEKSCPECGSNKIKKVKIPVNRYKSK